MKIEEAGAIEDFARLLSEAIQDKTTWGRKELDVLIDRIQIQMFKKRAIRREGVDANVRI
jgi:hypothetical protein